MFKSALTSMRTVESKTRVSLIRIRISSERIIISQKYHLAKFDIGLDLIKGDPTICPRRELDEDGQGNTLSF
ncbi:hypothetical protein EVAR_76721_1 [Eumeta japonica]|uniref:Uncharacterized protein n=1 Tax=Eumeta variegata TaxID=151549 RepID=A0A4C1SVN2_EUMVA|nr:hypothetical protein EVAR_76721_1 [Eumeta japonica]